MNRNCWVVAIAFACLITAQSQPPSPAPAKPGQKEQPTNHNVKEKPKINERPTVETPAALSNQPSAQSNLISQYSASNSQDKTSQDWWIRIFTGLLVIVGAIQIYVYWKQAGYMERTLGETKTATDAATKSANIAEQTLEISQRAYLTVGKPKVVLGGDGLEIPVRNYGHVPDCAPDVVEGW